MFILGFLTAAYFLIALFALMMTYDEQQLTGNRSMVLKSIGFLACLLWPLAFVTAMVTSRVA